MNAIVERDTVGNTRLVPRPNDHQPSESMAFIAMIERAARDPAVDIEKMKQLLAMRKEAMADEAQRAFDAALAVMQPKLPVVDERGRIKVGTEIRSTYAKWEDINEVIKPILAEHGFVLSHRVAQRDGKIQVTGVLAGHGHREETTIELGHDSTGSKNAVQAVGSSTSYGQRYTAKLLLNITSRALQDRDDDGASASDTITDEQVKELSDLLTETKSNIDLFLKAIKLESLTQIRANKFQAARDLITETAKKRAAREAEQGVAS